MSGFELRVFGVVSNCSTNWAKTAALAPYILWSAIVFSVVGQQTWDRHFVGGFGGKKKERQKARKSLSKEHFSKAWESSAYSIHIHARTAWSDIKGRKKKWCEELQTLEWRKWSNWCTFKSKVWKTEANIIASKIGIKTWWGPYEKIETGRRKERDSE